MNLGNTHTSDIQFKDVQRNINEREKEISRLMKQHNVPAEWFDVDFNSHTHNFKTEAVKEAYTKIVRYQQEIYQYINTFCISRKSLQTITEQIDVRVADAHNAKMAIVNAHLRLVVSIAKRFGQKTTGDEYLYLLQEGTIALMKAIDNFNYQSGYKFTTYATWWIRQGIARAKAQQNNTANGDSDTKQE